MIPVSITQEDIDAGVPCNGRACPVHRAVARATGSMDVWVDGMTIAIDGKEYRTPSIVETFINDLDSGRPVEPIDFQIWEEVEGL